MNKKVFISLFLIIFISLSCSVEKKDWEKADSENTIFAYERFLEKHTDGALAEKAREWIENFYFNEAATADSIQAYEKFLKSYSQGSHAYKARLRIEELRFEEAEYENTIPAYEYYLENFPDLKTLTEDPR